MGYERLHAIDDTPGKADVEFLDHQLELFNKQATGKDDFRSLNLIIRDEEKAVIAGLKAVTGWDWLYIQVLWVEADHRRKRVGSQLLRQAEDKARQRGCIGSCLSSYSFQAPEFYTYHGYTNFGKIVDYPKGNTMFFLSKRFNTGES